MSASRKPASRKSRLTDDEWIRRHFEELVDKYAGQYAVVAGGVSSLSDMTPGSSTKPRDGSIPT